MDLRATILDLAVDDFTGLWEIVWRGQSLMPEVPDDHVIQEAKKHALALIESAALAVFRGRKFDGDQVQLSTTEAIAAASEQNNRRAPDHGQTHIRVAATEAGERAYRGMSGGGT